MLFVTVCISVNVLKRSYKSPLIRYFKIYLPFIMAKISSVYEMGQSL